MPRIYKRLALDRPCADCGETDVSQFGFIKGKYRKKYCKKCAYARKEMYRKADPERHKEYQRDYYKRNRLRMRALQNSYKYGISAEERMSIINKENGICPICKKERYLVIDHNHKTGKVRGAICGLCNRLIGHANDDIAILQGAIKYLSEVPIKGI